VTSAPGDIDVWLDDIYVVLSCDVTKQGVVIMHYGSIVRIDEVGSA
jgi:hypothetical protein